MAENLLLISNSTVFGRGYLDHVAEEIQKTFSGVLKVLFFPYALYDMDGYADKARSRFNQLGCQLESIHQIPAEGRQNAVARAEALFIGGGNTFRLLHALYRDGLLPVIRSRVARDVPFIGASAGAIVAGPTIKTTKDMPVIQPPSFDSLGIFPYQISPHYLDPDPASHHMGETQEERIGQFLEENDTPVIGLRERSWIRQVNGVAVLKGPLFARVFRRIEKPFETGPGTNLTALLEN